MTRDLNPYPKPSNISRAWEEGYDACQRDVMQRLLGSDARKARVPTVNRGATLP